jgi:integrase
MPNTPRPPKLRQRSNGSLYAAFYDPNRSPKRKKVYLGIVLDAELDDPKRDASAAILNVFYDQYHDPYLRGVYDPWTEKRTRIEHITFKEAIDRFINRENISANTKRTLRLTLNEFEDDYLPDDIRPTGIRPEHVKSFIHRSDLSSAYRSSLYARLKAAFNWMIKEGLMPPESHPMDEVKRPRTMSSTKPFLMPSAFTSLIGDIEKTWNEKVNRSDRKGIKPNELQWVLPILRFGTATGLRPAEMRMLRVTDVNFDAGRVRVPALKGQTKGAERRVPLCQLAEEAARGATIGKSGSAYVFNGSRSQQFCTRRLSRVVKKHIKETDGVDSSLTLYASTRHTFASWLAMLGYPVNTIAETLGHSSTRVTEKYMHVAPSLLDRNMSARYQDFAEQVAKIGFFEPFFRFDGEPPTGKATER